MAFKTGNIAVFSMDSTEAGSLVDISAYVEKVTFTPSRDELKLPRIGGNAVAKLAGALDNGIQLEGWIDPTLTAMFTSALAVDAPVTRSFEYGPQGSTTGLPKRTGECQITNYSENTEGTGAGKWTATLAIDGDVTYGVY